ncbi:MAG TPA: SBBP repeat-containing protein, partial [Gemmataceae bacterium]|nr:SBBP repeat-containing protein [Gemmataceae bacterium]
FRFTASGKISAVNGGGGSDWLDYSAFKASQPVTVNLATGSATNVAGGAAGAVSNVQNVWGGAGKNMLTGDAQGNVLVGGAVADTITGGTGRSILVGSAGRDTITGESGSDILIPGTLSPDLNETALPLMLQEWQRTDISLGQRVADLRRGGGLNGGYKLLYGTTVLNDGGSLDTLTGASGQNWYFQFPGDNITNATAADLVQSQALPDGMLRRAFPIGGTGYDDGYNLTTDAQGNVYVVGDFQGTVNFNPNGTPVDLTAAAGPGSNGGDGYLAKYSPTGTLLWVQQFATDAADFVQAVGLTVDAAGNLLVDGWLTAATTFGSFTLPGLTAGFTGSGEVAFVAKLDAAGNVLWADQLGGTGSNTDTFCWNVTTDASANVYVVGGFGGTQTIGTTTLTSTGTWDGFVAKLGADGTLQWAKNTAAGSGITEAVAIALDKNGNIYTTGRFAGTGTFGKYSLTSQGGYDGFVTKLNSSGTTLWARDLGTSGNDYTSSIAVDKSGNLYVGGDVGGDPSSDLYGLVYVAKLNNAGTVSWSHQYGTGTQNEDGAGSLVLDAAGNVYVGGVFENTIAFGSFSFTSAGQENSFILKLNNAGSVQWAQAQVGPGDNYVGTILAVDPSLNVYAVGNFEQTMTVDTDPLGTATLTSAGSYDGFVMELSQRGPLTYTAPTSANPESYTLELNQGYLDLVDNNTGQVVAEKSVADTTAVQITAAAGVDATLVLDYGTGTTDVPVTFTGGSGTNTLVGPAQGASWSITAANAGKVGNVTFSQVANLFGGPGADSFKFSTKGSLSGSIAGEGGGDTLDYSAWTVAVTVDLTGGTATAVAGGVSGIDNVFGGNGNDTLTGSAAGGLLVGGSGTNVLTAGLGRSILISGSGSSTLLGGPSDDLLIAGTTTYDGNHAALMAILQEWQRPDKTYSQRITGLKKGGGDNGSYKLIWGSTVQDSGTNVDTLTGGTGFDWFFAQLAAGFVDDTITDLATGEQVN